MGPRDGSRREWWMETPTLTARPAQPNQRVWALQNKGDVFLELLDNPIIDEFVPDFLGDHYLIAELSANIVGPGGEAMVLHQDQSPVQPPLPVAVGMNMMLCLDDFTTENGATRVILGSNKLDDKLTFDEKDTEPAEMSKGSVLFYSGSIYHGGGANHSDATRVGINITYNVSWLRQEENQYLAVPLEVARTLPVDLLKLMGYRRGAYALGYVDDLRDPIEVVRPDLARTGLGDLDEVQKKLRKQGAQFSAGAAPK